MSNNNINDNNIPKIIYDIHYHIKVFEEISSCIFTDPDKLFCESLDVF